MFTCGWLDWPWGAFDAVALAEECACPSGWPRALERHCSCAVLGLRRRCCSSHRAKEGGWRGAVSQLLRELT